MGNKPDLEIFVDYAPKGPEFDLTQRVRAGVQMARDAGMDWAFIIEDDDYYPEHYFNIDLSFITKYGANFIGEYSTLYYNLINKTYTRWQHNRHSSLFTTGFRLEAMDDFPWPADNTVFLDVQLWKHITQHTRNTPTQRHIRESGALGMKHGIGVCGGKGHRQRNNNEDSVQMHWLRQNMDKASFDFYYTLIK